MSEVFGRGDLRAALEDRDRAVGHVAGLERQLAETLASYRGEVERVAAERDRVLAEGDRLAAELLARELANEGLAAQNDRLIRKIREVRTENARLRGLLNEASIADPQCTVRESAGSPHGVPEAADDEPVADAIPDDWRGEAMT